MNSIKIKGMSCNHCTNSVKEALEKLPGIKDVNVDLSSGEATYQGDLPIDQVRDEIVKIGFEVE